MSVELFFIAWIFSLSAAWGILALSPVHNNSVWMRSKASLGGLSNIPRARVCNLQNPNPDGPIAPHHRALPLLWMWMLIVLNLNQHVCSFYSWANFSKIWGPAAWPRSLSTLAAAASWRGCIWWCLNALSGSYPVKALPAFSVSSVKSQHDFFCGQVLRVVQSDLEVAAGGRKGFNQISLLWHRDPRWTEPSSVQNAQRANNCHDHEGRWFCWKSAIVWHLLQLKFWGFALKRYVASIQEWWDYRLDAGPTARPAEHFADPTPELKVLTIDDDLKTLRTVNRFLEDMSFIVVTRLPMPQDPRSSAEQAHGWWETFRDSSKACKWSEFTHLHCRVEGSCTHSAARKSWTQPCY